MTTSKSTLRNLAGTAAVALAFGPLANPANALDLNDNNTVLRYHGMLSNAIAQSAPNADQPRLRFGGFAVALEDALKSPADKTRVVDYPPRANAELLRILAVVPPKGLESQPIPVCAEQNNKVLGTWAITNKGEVLPVTGNWSLVSERPTSSACKEFILGQRSAINQLAQERANGAPAASTQPQPGQAQPGKTAALTLR
jgi:hypothetical protein